MESIYLQGIGLFQAKPSKEIVLNKDYFVWNCGYTSKPIKIIKETEKQIIFKTITKEGETYERRLNKNRLVAFCNNEVY